MPTLAEARRAAYLASDVPPRVARNPRVLDVVAID